MAEIEGENKKLKREEEDKQWKKKEQGKTNGRNRTDTYQEEGGKARSYGITYGRKRRYVSETKT